MTIKAIDAATTVAMSEPKTECHVRLVQLLNSDLDFHDQQSRYASHNFHSFPAKFPPQLPRKFIDSLTAPDDLVLDPMVGSGTTVVEALLAGRRSIGYDIDPLAIMISKVKTTSYNVDEVITTAQAILKRAGDIVSKNRQQLLEALETRWDTRTRAFVDNWFLRDIQVELLALMNEIETLPNPALRTFFDVAFSAVIITKSGGVSLALDLGHTRPHKAKFVRTRDGKILTSDNSASNLTTLSKTLRSPLDEFDRRVRQNVAGLVTTKGTSIPPIIENARAQQLPLDDASIDLIVTSPPYASNAIDYMRAHKFTLIWMGYSIDQLGERRREYIGSDATRERKLGQLPQNTARIVAGVSLKDSHKGRNLQRYYSEMTDVLHEMLRVLKPGSAAIVVVGTSILSGVDSHTASCLAEIGQSLGFAVVGIGERNLDRDRRMMPAGKTPNMQSQIQQRMHKEYVIGFLKPLSGRRQQGDAC